jgi:starch synthase
LAVYQTGTQAFKNNRSKPVKTILSIHNLPYMGKANRDILRQFGIQPSTNQSLPEWARELPLPMGIARADHVLTVSNGYAQEMMTPAFGCGLDSFLRKNHTKISGILNGIDPTIWNPQTDTFVHQNFSQTTLSSRLENKKKLFSQYFPGSSTALPLLIWIGRLQHQKGADIFLESLNNILNQQWRCIILGTGDIALEKAVNKFAVSNPEKIVAITEFSNTLSHQLYAGGDMIIIPSRYEPCGLSQMFAMRYGCLPIATATGGLKDTIADIRTSDNPDGFLFNDPVEKACSDTIEMAMDV